MQKIKKHKLYLSGGGDERQSSPLDSFFFAQIPRGGTFLYLPIAMRGYKNFATAGDWMKKVVALHKRHDITFTIWNSLENKKYTNLRNFDAIYIGGGNTWSLMKEIQAAGFDKSILKFLENKGPVYGGSAGAIILGKRIDTQEDDNKVRWKKMGGLNAIGEYSVACHFRARDAKKHRTWAMKNESSIVCLSEENGLIVSSTNITCIGKVPCRVYEARGKSIILHNRKSIKLKK